MWLTSRCLELLCNCYFSSFFFSKHSYSVDCVIFSSCVPDSSKEQEKFLIVMQLFSSKVTSTGISTIKGSFPLLFACSYVSSRNLLS